MESVRNTTHLIGSGALAAAILVPLAWAKLAAIVCGLLERFINHFRDERIVKDLKRTGIKSRNPKGDQR